MSDNALDLIDATREKARWLEQEKNPETRGVLRRGMSAGLNQMQGLGYGAGMLAADIGAEITGSETLRDLSESALEGYRRNMREAGEDVEGLTTDITDVDSVDKGFEWATVVFGQLIPNVATLAATGGVAGAAAGAAAKGLTKQVLAKRIGAEAAKRIAAGAAEKTAIQAATKAVTASVVKAAQAGGFAGASGVMSASEIGGQVATETGEIRSGVALAFGLPAGLLDALPIMRLAPKIGGRDAVASGVMSRLSAGAREAMTTALAEGSTEVAQTILEQAAVDYVEGNIDLFTPEDIHELVNVFPAGALGGMVMGGAVGLTQKPSPATPDPETLSVEEKFKQIEEQQDAIRERTRAAVLAGDQTAVATGRTALAELNAQAEALRESDAEPDIDLGTETEAEPEKKTPRRARRVRVVRTPTTEEAGETGDAGDAEAGANDSAEDTDESLASPIPIRPDLTLGDATVDGTPRPVTTSDGRGWRTEKAAERALSRSQLGDQYTVAPSADRFVLAPVSTPDIDVGGRDPEIALETTVDEPDIDVGAPDTTVDVDVGTIDAAANEAAPSPANERPEPTPAQQEAGNYKKGKLKLHGLDLSIEYPRGSERRGTAPDGTEWSRPMKSHYGYIRGTSNADGDQVNVMLTERADDPSLPVFVIDQVDPETGAYDEPKVIMGKASERAARRAYLSNYEKGWQGLGAISSMPLEEFREWVRSDAAQRPVALPETTAETTTDTATELPGPVDTTEIPEATDAAADVGQQQGERDVADAARETRKSLTTGEINRVRKRVLKRWKKAPPIEVVDRLSDIDGVPAEYDDGTIRGVWMAQHGRVYLVREALDSERKVEETILHEIQHAALGPAYGKDIEQRLLGLAELVERQYGTVQKYIKAKNIPYDFNFYEGYFNDRGLNERQRRVKHTDELLAHLAQERAGASGRIRAAAKAVLADIRRFLRELGFKLLPSLPDDELVQALRETRRALNPREEQADVRPIRLGVSEADFMKAWHGSPHRFDRFDISKIGTGEGAQTEGYGLYFSDEKAVGEWYRETYAKGDELVVKGQKRNLGDPSIEGKAYAGLANDYLEEGDFNDAKDTTIGVLENRKRDAERSIDLLQSAVESHESGLNPEARRGLSKQVAEENLDLKRKVVAEYDRLIKEIGALKKKDVQVKKGGRLFEVDLAPTEEEFLDWEKPLGQQSELVKNALRSAKVKFEPRVEYDEETDAYYAIDIDDTEIDSAPTRQEAETIALEYSMEPGGPTGRDLYEELVRQRESRLRRDSPSLGRLKAEKAAQKATSEFLRSIGIRGNRYLGGGVVDGDAIVGRANNYVVFDDADVDVVAMFSKKPPTALQSSLEIARKEKFANNRQLKVRLQELAKPFMEELGIYEDHSGGRGKKSEEYAQARANRINYMANNVARDARFALKENSNAIGWYDKTVREALSLLALTHPEIDTDPEARFAFRYILAVTSNGLKVDKNFELADAAYQRYKEIGRMPTDVGIGTAAKAINDSLRMFNDKVDQMGIGAFAEFMDTDATVGELVADGHKISGEQVGTKVKGSAILGPKIGGGFFQNLGGNFDPITIDRWLMRTWGRWNGTLISERPDMVNKKSTELRSLIDDLSENMRPVLDDMLDGALETGDMSAVAKTIQKKSVIKQWREEISDLDDGAIRKAGNSLAKWLDGQKEAPANATERAEIREAFAKGLKVLQKSIPELTMADLQALLWYPEKRLYDVAKGDNAASSYNDDEAPDYANAAASVARKYGIPQETIDATRQQARAEAAAGRPIDPGLERRTDRRSGDVRRGVREGDGGATEDAPAFSRPQRQEVPDRVSVVHDIRRKYRAAFERRGSDALDRPFAQGGRGNAGRDGLVGTVLQPQEDVVSEFAAVGEDVPRFIQLDPSDAAARGFHEAISKAKAANRFGASVYVYDEPDYRDMALYLTESGDAGFAIKSDGDLVSVFSTPGSQDGRVGVAITMLGVQEGATKLDAFDTILPGLYSIMGFRETGRDSWSDEYMPDGWDKSLFSPFNGGEPDVVYMEYDPANFDLYTKLTDAPSFSRRAGTSGNAASALLDRLNAAVPNASASVTQRGNVLVLDRLVIPEGQRDEGLGSRWMQALTDYADENDLRVALTADGDFGGTRAGQQRFYRRFGFRPNTGRSRDFEVRENMVREPRGSRTIPSFSRPIHSSLAQRPDHLAPWSRGTARENLMRMGLVAKRTFVDRYAVLNGVQRAIEESGVTIDEREDAYLAEELFHGKAEDDLEQMRTSYVEPLAKRLAKSGITQADLDRYLVARHAQERNEHIASINPKMPDGGSGMATAEAQRILAEIESSDQAGEYEALARIVYDMLSSKRDVVEQHGLAEPGEVDAWRAAYRYYVPLKGYADDEPNTSRPGTGSGYSIGGRESRRSTGRGEGNLPASPSTQAISDLTEKLIRRRKNDVGNAFLNLVQANPDPAFWEVFTDDNPETAPQSVVVQQANIAEGIPERREVRDMPIPMAMMQDRYFTTKVDGKTYYIKLADDRLRDAMNNVGPQTHGAIVRTLSAVTRFLSAMNTSYNPEFLVTNAFRDLQTAALNLSAEQSRDDGRIAGEEIVRNVIRDVPNAMRGAWAALRNREATGATEEWKRLYREYVKAGGKTGNFSSKDIDEQMREVQSLVSMASGSAIGTARQFMRDSAQLVEDMNGAVENAVRLSAFKHARDAGLSEAKAASLAKNMTVNFNRRGEAGTALNALYMFANASIQGTVNFARTLGGLKGDKTLRWRNLNNAQRAMLGIMGGTFALAMINRLGAEEDEDGVSWYDKVPHYIKERNLVIMKSLFGGPADEYWAIPLPYGYNVANVIGTGAEAVVSGAKRPGEAAGELALAIAGSFSPIGYSASDTLTGTLLKNATPTIAKPMVDVAMNENYFGGQVFRENLPFGTPTPDSQMARRNTGRHYTALAEWLNDVTGGSEFRSGAIDVNPDVMAYFVDYALGASGGFFLDKLPDAAIRVGTGTPVAPQKVPFLGRLNGQVMPFEDRNLFYKRRDEINQLVAEQEALTGPAKRTHRQRYADKMRLETAMKQAEKRLRELSKRRDKIYAAELGMREREERLEALNKRMKAVVDRFNKRWLAEAEQ